MGRDYKMKWDKFTGTITGKHSEATCAMIDNAEGWSCSWGHIGEESAELEVKTFESGQLGAAHEWCIEKIDKHESRKSK